MGSSCLDTISRINSKSYQFYRKKKPSCTWSHVLSPPQKRHLICFIQSSDVHSHLLNSKCMPELWAARVWILSVGSILSRINSIAKKNRAAHGLMCCPHHRKDISYASYSPQTFIVIYCMPELWAAHVWILSVGSILSRINSIAKKNRAAHGLMCCPHHRKDISYSSYSPRTFIVIYCMPELWAARVSIQCSDNQPTVSFPSI